MGLGGPGLALVTWVGWQAPQWVISVEVLSSVGLLGYDNLIGSKPLILGEFQREAKVLCICHSRLNGASLVVLSGRGKIRSIVF